MTICSMIYQCLAIALGVHIYITCTYVASDVFGIALYVPHTFNGVYIEPKDLYLV